MTNEQLLVLWVIAGLLQIPNAREVWLQLRLQARLAALLPDETWAKLPAHRRARPVWLGSPRFCWAWFRFVHRDVVGEGAHARVLKLQLRASVRRHIPAALVGAAAFACVVTLQWRLPEPAARSVPTSDDARAAPAQDERRA